MPNTVNSYIETDLGNVSPNPRGEYNATYDYEYLDLIYYKGGSYLCLAPLGETIKNIPPIEGQTTTNWQCVAIPGDITPEYISMYNEVVKDYNETNTNTADVTQMKASVYASMTAAQESENKAGVSEVNARASEVSAKQSMDKAKEYADDAMRSNNDTQELVSGFDARVATAISNAEASISESTENAKDEIIAQKSSSLNEFRADAETVMTNEKNVAVAEIHNIVDDFDIATDAKEQEVIALANEKINAMTALKNDAVNAKNAAETASTTAFEKANEATTSADEAKTSSDEAKANAELVAADKAIVAADKTEIGGMKSAVESSVAKFESDLETYNLPTMNNDINELKGDLASFQKNIAEKVNPKNWLNLSAVKTGVILYTTDGQEHENANFIVTDKIKIGYGETVSCYKKNDMTLINADSICCYDAQGNYLGGKAYVSNYSIEYENTAYIRISLGLAVHANRMIYIGSDTPTEASDYFTPYYVVKKDNRYIEKNWTNKKVLILGDSIMSLKHENVSNALIELLQPSKYVNIAVPGASWCEPQTSVLDGNPTSDNPPSNHIANQIQKIILSKDTDETYFDFDYCIIGAGTNDFAGWFQFEDVTEEQLESYFIGDNGYIDVNTITRKNIIGAMRYGIEKIRELYPNIVIFISLPIQSAYGYGVQRNPDYLKKKCELMKRICFRMGEQYIETNLCGIYAKNETKDSAGLDLKDGLHPNEHGSKKEARYIVSKIAEYFLSSN